jgi:hypothetical protein
MDEGTRVGLKVERTSIMPVSTALLSICAKNTAPSAAMTCLHSRRSSSRWQRTYAAEHPERYTTHTITQHACNTIAADDQLMNWR